MLHMVTTQIALVLRAISSNSMEDLLSSILQNCFLSQLEHVSLWLLFVSYNKLGMSGTMVRMHSISCNNRQTVDAINKDAIKLTTKLCRIDIHHWLRQFVHAPLERRDVRDGYVNADLKIEWIAIDMVADGLTKRLTREKHQRFLEQLNLHDIGSMIQG
jgi:hypothetical protein